MPKDPIVDIKDRLARLESRTVDVKNRVESKEHDLYSRIKGEIAAHRDQHGRDPIKITMTRAEADRLRAELRIRPDSGPIILKGVPVEEID